MGLSGTHMFLIFIVVLVAFGPKRIGPLGRSFGEAIRGFKKGLKGDEIDVTDSVRRESLNQAPPSASGQFQPQHQSQNYQQNNRPSQGAGAPSNGGQGPNKKS